MTPTFSQQTYTDLLTQHQPKPIKTESEHHRALAIVERMMSGELTEAETTLFELLVLLIETYEQSNYPMGESTPGTTLSSLMHEFDVEAASLVEVLGSFEVVTKVLNNQQELSQSQAESLAQFFNEHYSGLSLTAKDFQVV
ncbi:MAG: transcriptional regulator [Scytonematopsis contorta HA4267-MV1]|jgi:HTH-type transcriptional regulator/antitoxin HigA|nr:transcriptional regulator [Scytonematopsis contorta HA4267-MV1]